MELHSEAVSPNLWALLLRLLAAEPLKEFSLAGGTALALHYGHRISMDIDLFTHQPFDAGQLTEFLSEFFELTQSTTEKNTVLGIIENIKVDCLTHQYPLIRGVQKKDNIRLLSVEDIAAMKLNAIANRGCKKDFWDLFELIQHFERDELLAFYERKYPHSNVWTVEKSLSYFDDAENDPNPLCLKGLSWKTVKSGISNWNRL